MSLFLDPIAESARVAEALTEESRAYCRQRPLPRQPLVSVIMPCLNVAETIEPVLKGFEAQTYRHFELIINLDRRSKDGSEALIRPFVDRDPRFRLLFENTGMAQGRNAGRAAAQGEYLANWDADLAPTPTVLEEAVTRAELEGADILVCPELSRARSFWGVCRALEKLSYLEDPVQESSGRFVRRQVAEALGPVDESLLAGEDYDYFLRAKSMGFKPGRLRAISWHHEYWTLLGKARKLYRYGRSFPPYLKKYPVLGTKQFFIVRRAYLTHLGLYASDPVHTAGTIAANLLFYVYCGWGLARGYVDVFRGRQKP
jgi:glycosyltransferase involved in cell wall biosynthesis